jgi:acyl dehydratase
MTAATIPATIVGAEVGPLAQRVDARWLMAYAAGLGETDPRYFDTLAAGGPAAHPLFPVCYEWPVAVALRAKTIDEALAPRGVHATHRVVIHRPPRAGETLVTTARVSAAEPRRAGTLVVLHLTTVDEAGRPVTTTEYGSVYRGASLAGEPVPAPRAAVAPPPPGIGWVEPLEIAATAAHVYTECARIWNPIHTDVVVARANGLPGVILHGTATLALAVSRVVARDLDGDPARVGEVRARFSGMVAMPSRLAVRGWRAGDGLGFDVLGADGARVLDQGLVVPCAR